jgi:hypothetical protein
MPPNITLISSFLRMLCGSGYLLRKVSGAIQCPFAQYRWSIRSSWRPTECMKLPLVVEGCVLLARRDEVVMLHLYDLKSCVARQFSYLMSSYCL